MRMFDVDETEQFEFHHELKEHEETVHFLLWDICNRERLIRTAEDVDIIFHTAALKLFNGVEYNSIVAGNLFLIIKYI